MLVIFAYNDLILTIIAFARVRLTSKQKKIINFIQNNSFDTTVTQAVSTISKELDSSASSIWLNLGQLKSIHIIDYAKGKPLTLTDFGFLVGKNIYNGGQKNE